MQCRLSGQIVICSPAVVFSAADGECTPLSGHMIRRPRMRPIIGTDRGQLAVAGDSAVRGLWPA